MPSKPLFILTLLLLPALASADGFVPLVGIPGIDANNLNFNDYINALYALSISIAALIAVIKIIIAGVKWMLSDIASSKQEAKSDIQGALLGLLLIIAAVLILEVINPQLKSSSLFLGKVDTVTRAPAAGDGEGRALKNRAFATSTCPNNNNNTSGCQLERAKCATDGGRVISGQYGTMCSFDAVMDSGVSPMNPGVGGGGGTSETGLLVGGKFTDNSVFPDGTEVPTHFTEISDKIDVINKSFPTRAPNLNDAEEWFFVWRILNNTPFQKGSTGSSNKSYATRIMEESDCKTCFKHPEDYIDQINAARTGGGSAGGGNTGDLSGNDYGNPAISAISSEPVKQGRVTITTMAPATISDGVAHLQALVEPGTMSVYSVYGTSENNLDQKSSYVFDYSVSGTTAAKALEANTSYEKRLTPNTVYYYKVCAINEARTITPVCGNLMKFKTVP